MPACITHMLIAREALRRVEEAPLRKTTEENFHAYAWGSQGPDLLMHGGYFPWHKISNLVLIGKKMHKESIDDIFEAFYGYIKGRREKSDFPVLLAYVLGYITHHSADKTFHPYVYDSIECMSRRFKKMTANILHYKVEENIDVALLEWLYHETPLQFTAYHLLRYQEEICLPIAQMFHRVLGERFGREVSPKEIMNAFKDMRFLQKSLFDPYGIIGSVNDFLQDLTGSPVQLSYMTHRARLDNRFDYCNFDHRVWYNSHDPDFSSKEDIFELFDRACLDAAGKIDTFYRYLQEDKKSLAGLFQNLSFNSGLPANAQP